MRKFTATKAFLRSKVDHHREESKREGTLEWRHLRDLNTQVKAYNNRVPRGIRKGRKQRVTTERA